MCQGFVARRTIPSVGIQHLSPNSPLSATPSSQVSSHEEFIKVPKYLFIPQKMGTPPRTSIQARLPPLGLESANPFDSVPVKKEMQDCSAMRPRLPRRQKSMEDIYSEDEESVHTPKDDSPKLPRRSWSSTNFEGLDALKDEAGSILEEPAHEEDSRPPLPEREGYSFKIKRDDQRRLSLPCECPLIDGVHKMHRFHSFQEHEHDCGRPMMPRRRGSMNQSAAPTQRAY